MGRTKTKVFGEEVEKEVKKSVVKEDKKKEIAEDEIGDKATGVAIPEKDEKKVVQKEKRKPLSKPGTIKKRKSKKYLATVGLVNKKKVYRLEDAIKLVKQISYSKFDETVEVHIRTVVNKRQDLLRGMVVLPSGSPKTVNVKIADEKTIEEIKSGKIDFDVLLSTPEMMPKLASVAKILGPRGLMPNPKSGTVTANPEESAKELINGRIEYKTDSLGNIHSGLAKVSWDDKKIMDNINALINVIPVNRILSISICSSMGPGVKIK